MQQSFEEFFLKYIDYTVQMGGGGVGFGVFYNLHYVQW